MSAVPSFRAPALTLPVDTGRSSAPAHRRRVVAVAVDPMELLRPESDLVRLLEDFPRIDLLVATDDHGADPGPADLDGEDDLDADLDDTPGRIAELGLPGLHVHRLRLRPPLAGPAENDLVAALSELVGFDPEPGVYCVAPVATDPHRSVADRAAQRIARVYGLPLLRYRSLELCVVGAGAP